MSYEKTLRVSGQETVWTRKPVARARWRGGAYARTEKGCLQLCAYPSASQRPVNPAREINDAMLTQNFDRPSPGASRASRAPRHRTGYLKRSSDQWVPGREHPSPMMKANDCPAAQVGRDVAPEKSMQGQQLSFEDVPPKLVRHDIPQVVPIDSFLASCEFGEIVEVPEVDAPAPVIALFDEVVHDPVQRP